MRTLLTMLVILLSCVSSVAAQDDCNMEVVIANPYILPTTQVLLNQRHGEMFRLLQIRNSGPEWETDEGRTGITVSHGDKKKAEIVVYNADKDKVEEISVEYRPLIICTTAPLGTHTIKLKGAHWPQDAQYELISGGETKRYGSRLQEGVQVTLHEGGIVRLIAEHPVQSYNTVFFTSAGHLGILWIRRPYFDQDLPNLQTHLAKRDGTLEDRLQVTAKLLSEVEPGILESTADSVSVLWSLEDGKSPELPEADRLAITYHRCLMHLYTTRCTRERRSMAGKELRHPMILSLPQEMRGARILDRWLAIDPKLRKVEDLQQALEQQLKVEFK